MPDKDEIIKKAMRHMGKPIDEITRRNTYRARSPGVKPTTGIKLNLPKTSTMAMKMQRILDDESAEGRKKQKQMANLVIGREESDKEISLEFKTAASRERFRKMMNESVELDEMKKSDGPFTVVAIKNNKVVGQLRNVEHYDIEVAIDMMRKDKQGAKISVESKSGKVVHTEEVELDESVKIMFKGFDMEQRVFTAKLKKFGFDKEYRKMMQNFMKHANSGDGFYFIDGGRELGFQVHPVSDMMMGNKIKKLGDKQDLGGGKTATLIAIKEDVQVNEMSPFNVMGGKKTATPRKMGRDLENRLKMTKPSEYTFSAPAAGGGTFAVIPVNMERPSMISQAGVMMATFDKRGKVLAYYGTHMNTDAAKKFAKKEGLIESVQLDEGTLYFVFDNAMKAGAFARRVMRDKLASEVDRYVDFAKRKEVVEVITHPDLNSHKKMGELAKRYKGEFDSTDQGKEVEKLMREDVGLEEGKMQDAAKKLPYNTKKLLAKQLNRMNLGGYGDYEARVDNVHKFKDTDLAKALRLVHPAAVAMALKEAETLRWSSMKDFEREELVRLAGVPSRAVTMEWKQIPAPLKEKLAKYINKSTKGEYELDEIVGVAAGVARGAAAVAGGVAKAAPKIAKVGAKAAKVGAKVGAKVAKAGAKVAKKVVNKAATKVAKATKSGAKAGAKAVKTGVKKTGQSVKKAGKEMGREAAREFGREAGREAARVAVGDAKKAVKKKVAGVKKKVAGVKKKVGIGEADIIKPKKPRSAIRGPKDDSAQTSRTAKMSEVTVAGSSQGRMSFKKFRQGVSDFKKNLKKNVKRGAASGAVSSLGSGAKIGMGENLKLDERGLPTYVYDRKTGEIVYGPTDVADAKLFVKKQIQPRKFVIRQKR